MAQAFSFPNYGLFNSTYYLQQNKDVADSWSGSPLSHYIAFGAKEGRAPAAWFDAQFYRSTYSDLQSMTALQAFAHYNNYGFNEGRVPSLHFSNFNGARYIADNADVGAAGYTAANAISHYVQYGENEGRAAYTTNNVLITSVTTAGQSYSLTTNIDNIDGTSGNDMIAGAAGTLQPFDSIDGMGGVDTLKLVLNASTAVGAADITNIEELSITSTVTDAVAAVGGTFNLSGIAGLTLVENNASSNDATGGNDVQTFSNVGSLANVSVKNTDGDTTVIYADTVVAGAANAVTLSLANVAQANAIAVALDNTTTVTGATGIETLNVNLAGPVGTTANTVTLNTNATASLSTVNLSGSGVANITLGANPGVATTINASATTGGVTISGFGNANQTVTGGTGNDVFRFGANFTRNDTVNGGAGVDTLAANGAQLAAIVTPITGITNIETLGLQDDVAAVATVINAANFGSSITNLRISDQAAGAAGAANIRFDNVVAAAAGTANNVRFDGSISDTTGGLITINIANATDPGTANSVNLDLRGGANTATSAIALAGVETVTIDTTNATATKLFTLTDASLQSLTIKGAQAVDLDSVALGGNVSTVDASGITAGTGGAGLNLLLSGAATTGANVTGSRLIDTVTGSNLRDIINTAGGNDVVNSSGGRDTVTLGTGNDVLRINNSGTAVGDANMITVTDFVVGTDTINLTQGGAGATLAGVTIGAATTAAALATPLSSTTAVNSVADVYTQLGNVLTAANFLGSLPNAGANQIVSQVVSFTNGANAGTYLVVNDSAAGFNGTNDLVIQLTGIDGTFAAGSFTFTV